MTGALINFDMRPSRTARRDISILDLLVWAFRTECASIDFEDDVAPAQSVVGGTYLVARHGRLGCRIDGGGRSEPHPDADIVASAVSVLPIGCGGRGMAVTIAELARAGDVPDWMPGATPHVEPVAWGKRNQFGAMAKTEVVGTHERMVRGRRVIDEVRVCPVRIRPAPSQIAAARRAYLLWWSALLELRYNLSVGSPLSCWSLTDEMPLRAPWTETC